jgi:Uma2 family endonuclease
MAAVTHHRRLIPVDEWRAVRLPEGIRAELIGGELVVTPAPSVGHAFIATFLARALDNGEVPDQHFVLTSAVEWEITVEPRMLTGALQPDLVVVEMADVARLTRPPLLAAEVLSPSDRRLLEQSELTRIEGKRLDYATGGLADYLEVDRASGVITVTRYELHAGVLRVADVATGGGTLSATRPFSYTVRPADLLPST